MPKQSVLSNPSHAAHLPKQGFNLSHSLKFTSSCGHLLPVMYDILYPGDKIKVNHSLFTRTMPLQTAAMSQVDEFVDYFFVPMQKIYSLFPQLIMSVNDYSSVLLNDVFTDRIMEGSEDYHTYVFPQFDFEIFHDVVAAGNSNPIGFQYSNRHEPWLQGALRLLDLLNYPDLVRANDVYRPFLNPMLACAYQACYFDYYRLTEYEPNRPDYFNVDDLIQERFNEADINSDSISRFCGIFQLRYRAYSKDFFTSVHRNPFGFQNVYYSNDVNSTDLNSWLNGADLYVTDNVGIDPDTVNTDSILTAFAYRKLLAISGRASGHYDDQVLAHFGFKVPRGISNEVCYLGGAHQNIKIGEVISTSDTANGSSGAALGQVAGKGYGITGSNSDIRFTAPCHGVLMAIYSASPVLNYVTPMDKFHTYGTKFDFYQPEFDKLGLQPLFGYQVSQRATSATRQIGWNWRYLESKLKVNRVTRAFFDVRTGDDSLWPLDSQGPFASWTNVSQPLGGQSSVTGVSDFLVSPEDMNGFMLFGYNAGLTPSSLIQGDYQWWKRLYALDPLIHNIDFKYYKVSCMSTYGIDDYGI